MSYYEVQLWLGVAAVIVWSLVGLRASRNRRLGEVGITAVTIAFAAALVILVFGSLRLLEIIDDGAWFVVGTGLRVVVAAAGLLAFWDMRPSLVKEFDRTAIDLMTERNDAVSRIAAKLDENTRITQEASDSADRAYEVANNVNERISAQDVVIETQGATLTSATERVEDKVTDTRERVIDLQERADGR